MLDGTDIYDGSVDPMAIRRRIGMVFQRPNPFPTLSICRQRACLCGASRNAARREAGDRRTRVAFGSCVDEVKDKLKSGPLRLSGGQQQRMCIARCGRRAARRSLDGRGDGIARSDRDVGDRRTDGEALRLVYDRSVTHNMQQAARVSDVTAFMLADESGTGRLSSKSTKRANSSPSRATRRPKITSPAASADAIRADQKA